MRRRSSRCRIVLALLRCRVPRSLFFVLLLLAITADSHAANRRWSNGTASFVFNTGGNWAGGVTPGLLDVAQFGLSPMPPFFRQIYTVSFNNNATNQALEIEDDLVTFNLNSFQYTVTAATGIAIGTPLGNGFAASLTVNNGRINSSTNIDVGAAATKSGSLIVGANGLISGAPTINIGKLSTGTLTVQFDGDITSTGATTIGVGNGITGTATIIGNGTAGSATLFTGTLNVGSTGIGTVNVQLGGLLQNSGAAVLGTGNLFTGVGTGIVNVMNSGSIWNSLGLVEVGDGGFGEVNIALGGTVNGTDNIVGSSVNGGGEVNVDGMSSLWDSSGTVTVGGLGAGTLNITNQGVVESTSGVIGSAGLSTSNGTVNVSGAGSRWSNTGVLTVGNAGTGTLNIKDGGLVVSQVGIISKLAGGTGTVTVSGTGSLWMNSGALAVGADGPGELEIKAGAHVENTSSYIGGYFDSTDPGTGAVTVSGTGSLWTNSGDVSVGFGGDGTLDITDDGQVRSDGIVSVNGDAMDATLNITAGGQLQSSGGTAGATIFSTDGTITVSGTGSLWMNSGTLELGGNVGRGTLNITDGAEVHNTDGFLGVEVGSPNGIGGTGEVTVSGLGSLWMNSGDVSVGFGGDGTLDIADSGRVDSDGIVSVNGRNAVATVNVTAGSQLHSQGGSVGADIFGDSGLITVSGPGSLWMNSGTLELGGGGGDGTLNITAGGVVQNNSSFVGVEVGGAPGTGAVTVSGAGSLWTNSGDVSVGFGGEGTLIVTGGAIVHSSGDLFVAVEGDGSLQITAGGQAHTSADAGLGVFGGTGNVTVSGSGSNWTIDGRLIIGGRSDASANSGTGTVRIQPGGTVTVTQDAHLWDEDALHLEGGTLSTSGINVRSGGHFFWTSGTLHVGVVNFDLQNPSGGILAPGNSAGSTVILGDYSQLVGATLDIEIGGTAATVQYDRLTVSGNAVLGGNLQLSMLGGFVPSPADAFFVFEANNPFGLTSVSGAFANVANGQRLTTSDGLGSFVVNYGAGSAFGPTRIVLSNFLVAALPGDYNQNGTVDAADYTLWRDNLGSPTALPNDDTPGVGQDDYTRWKNNFGTGSTGSGAGSGASATSYDSAVPEPTTAAQLAILFLVVSSWRLVNR